MDKKKNPSGDGFDASREEIHRQMLSSVSHDLKTPLATIIGSLEIFVRMEAKLTPDKKASLINSALSEGYRLDNFITNILDMAKLEGDMVKAKPEKCNLTAILNDSLTRLGPRRAKGTIQLDAATSDTHIVTDPMLLGRAAGLLIENSLKHGGKQPIVLVKYGVSNNESFIFVSDNGPGIQKGMEKAIFSKYTRLTKSDQQNAGTGLGLAICQSIIKLIHGEVKGENLPAGGAIFSLLFPAKLEA